MKLTASEERRLVRLAQEGDLDARNRLVAAFGNSSKASLGHVRARQSSSRSLSRLAPRRL